jgi:hypothetical protein
MKAGTFLRRLQLEILQALPNLQALVALAAPAEDAGAEVDNMAKEKKKPACCK